uniref:Probable MAD2-spindle-assembly checkpoint protein n=1 Tax=Melanopsichium pennsylvanicum 4 TaxID=1398559 RepID=A0A077QWZ7_9BASI|nr:probable MAD2-spindle-assembly checkpoint protein [Melanopsichium pennsylvanicum 4]
MATAQAQANTRTHLTLKGSTALVHEFFTYSVQSILYQRNIYPSDDFKTVKKYDEPCAFQILAYTNKNAQAPKEWTDSDPRLIQQGQAEQVRLRSFSTHVHTVEGMVAYRREQDDD